MGKYILVTDTHIGVKYGSSLYHNVTKRLFATIFDYATHNKIDKLIHLGDFWDNRKTVSIKTILTGLSVIDNINKVFKETYLIIGNHDTIYKDSIEDTLLTMFLKYENVSVIKEPTYIHNILLLPWMFSPEILENEKKVDICMGHFDINGCVMNEAGSRAENKHLSQSDFKKFKLVLSGHYHTPETYNNIRYLGSPFHTSFNDVAGTRGFYVLDNESCELEFIEFTDYPKYIRVKDTDNPEKIASLVPNNIVELIFTKDYGLNGNIELVERVKNLNPLTLMPKYVMMKEIMSHNDNSEQREQEVEVKDHLGLLQEYYGCSELPEYINVSVLNEITKKIYEEVTNGK